MKRFAESVWFAVFVMPQIIVLMIVMAAFIVFGKDDDYPFMGDDRG